MPFPTPLDKRLRVLLIDDSFDDRFLVSEYCKGFDFPVALQVADSLSQGNAFWRKQVFDVVLLDLDLGEISGVSTLVAARRLFLNTAIVLLTGNDDEGMMSECLRSGAQDFLVKGRYNRVELEKAIRFAIVRHVRIVELEHKTEELDFMLDTQEIGLFILNEANRIIHCNHAVCEILELEEKELLGVANLMPVPKKGASEVDFGTESGKRKVLEVRSTLSEWRGQTERLVTVIDVTQRKEMERRASEGEKLETVARVCFGVAHEFNNLLAMTRTKTDFLETLSSVDPVWAAHIEDLQMACERGSGLVKQLMTFYGRDETGRHEESSLEIGTFLRSWEPHLESMLGLNGSIELILADEPLEVRISESNLGKVLAGLVENARDAMTDGGCIKIRASVVSALELKLRNAREGQEYVCLSVIDSGCGIALEDHVRVFEPFYTTKDTRAGRGLGLSVVSNLLREHGGTIEFVSEPGVGSEFRVLLERIERPVDVAEKKIERYEEEEAKTVEVFAESASRLRVLVVDDEPIIRFSVARLLEASGCEVDCAENGESALIFLEDVTQPLDVLLTDINMPVMGGIELANRALYLRDRLRVVVMSGYGAGAVDPNWLQQKRVSFLGKPFKKDELRAVVLLPSGTAS